MLSEKFVTAIQAPAKSINASVLKDIGIHLHELQPQAGIKSTYKKSSSSANSLAITSTHIFAAQIEKAVVHVYDRNKGAQEAIVPFPEKVKCLTFIGENGGAGCLCMGTENGRLMIWEVATGRLISTSQSHLQAVTSIVVDGKGQIALTGSADSNINVWSLSSLLDFSLQSSMSQDSSLQLARTLSNHRGPITCLTIGRSSTTTNIAISGSTDNTLIVWDYTKGVALRTYLLLSTPISLALDPCERAIYTAYDDGRIQFLDLLFANQSAIADLHDPKLQPVPVQATLGGIFRDIQSADLGAINTLALNFDGTSLLTGHESGKICLWDTAKRQRARIVNDLNAPITNLVYLQPKGFLNEKLPSMKLHKVIKPKYESAFIDDRRTTGVIPGNYTINVQFERRLSFPASSDVATQNRHLDDILLENDIDQLSSLRSAKAISKADARAQQNDQEKGNITELEIQLSSLSATHRETLRSERKLQRQIAEFQKLEEKRRKRKRSRAIAKFAKSKDANGTGKSGVSGVSVMDIDNLEKRKEINGQLDIHETEEDSLTDSTKESWEEAEESEDAEDEILDDDGSNTSKSKSIEIQTG